MRKRRTREHIIADLVANHLERYVLKCGFTVEKIQHDYGLDMIMYTYQPTGEIQDGFVNIQLKASDKIKYDESDVCFSFPVELKHLSHWLDEPFPVFLIIYDTAKDKAYWVYIQNYFESMPAFSLKTVKKTYSIRVPMDQVIDQEAIRKFAEFKQSVLNQIDGVIRHA